MGKASSAKKVARVAGTGGSRIHRKNRSWGYTLAIAVVVVVGVALTYTSRQSYLHKIDATTAANAKVAPLVGGTPWNEGYAVDICGKWQKPIDHPKTSTGISTAGNGVIHIAPKVASAAGKNATLGVFASSVGMTLSANQVQLPGGKDYVSGAYCGSRPAEVFVKQYAFAGDPTGAVLSQNPISIRLADQAEVTIAFLPHVDKAKIPAPPAYVSKNLAKALAATTPTTTVPSSTTTKAPAKSTTKAGSKTTTKTTAKAAAKASANTTAGSKTTTGSKSSAGAAGTSAKAASGKTSSGT